MEGLSPTKFGGSSLAELAMKRARKLSGSQIFLRICPLSEVGKIVNQFLIGTRFIVSVHMKKIHQLRIFIRLRLKTEANKLFRTRGNETTQVVLKPG